ncbi:putative NAD(P)/FAD-binding protein YdhS [Kribbella aluminosa]|uniref:NAD(P)/FAD-binding protein YdhS n=1 Tax=Kribbella aluminosa TaxID=416017 RepID=A0ABS4UD78_9ACTN|nr:FAD/NAD(P)-binding protein [Kribbella aluminosa]MBP2349603.1 putative NAD(P)/FAD-binding protein YdhS [Kribbella aluminosa]
MTVSEMRPWKVPPATVVFVGGGPRTVGLLERFAAGAEELLEGRDVHIHVVDPYPVGGGRIWRREQSRLLWMNSMTSDITIFTDESVECEGPIVPGPDLASWVAGEGAVILEKAGLEPPGPMDFPPRLVQAEYLAWVWERVVRDLPATVSTHRERAVELTADQRVILESGTEIAADAVVLALGYLDRLPTASESAWAAQAADAGLTYIPPGYTADVDLDGLWPQAPVIVRGFGQAFVDLMVLLTEGRGGWYDECDGLLTYRPSGDEPILYVGSRRGVPYHAKLGYTVAGTKPVPTHYLTKEALGDGPLDFDRDVLPLIEKELAYAHYKQLFGAHSERVRMPWEEFAKALDSWTPVTAQDWGHSGFDVEPVAAPSAAPPPARGTTAAPPSAWGQLTDAAFAAVVAGAVPDPVDRFVRREVDRPLDGLRCADRERFEQFMVELIEDDLLRRADPSCSADLAVFNALLSVYSVLSRAITDGQLSDEDRVRKVEREWHGFFSFVASGPPPRRLEELLALHRAGIVRFAGPDLDVAIDNDEFVARSPGVAGEIRARAFVEARLPSPDVLAASDPLLRGLLGSGALAADELFASDGTSLGGGQLKADSRSRAVRADGSVHPALFLLGPSVSGSAGSSGFSRPHFNGPGFRQNDAVARDLLKLLAPTVRKEERHAS